MILSIKTHLLAHALFWLNILVFCLLLFGLIAAYGVQYIDETCYYILPFILTYVFLHRKKEVIVISENSMPKSNEKVLLRLVDVMLIGTVLFQIVHFIMLGHVPIITAAISNDYYGIAFIRQSIKELDITWINYGSAFLMKAIMPFGLFLLYQMDKKRFWIYFIICSFYALALMQKALIISILIPLITYLLLQGKWIKSTLLLTFAMIGIVFLVYVTNPELRPFNKADKTSSKVVVQVDAGSAIAGGISDRIFKLTGKMVGNWFKYVPDTIPFQYGNGYRLVAKAKGEPFADISREIYKKMFLKETKLGLEGTATSAFFMYDYANFGKYGLVLAGILLAAIFKLINRLFGDDWRSKIALNSLSVFWLSSAALTSTLLSGGWAIIILMYFVFKPLILRVKA